MNTTRGIRPTTIVSSLDSLLADSTSFTFLAPEVQDEIYEKVLSLEAKFRAKVLTRRHTLVIPSKEDDLVLVAEAAALLRTSRDSLYSKWSKLPFAFKDPIDGRVKFSRNGIQKYIARRMGSL